MIMMFPAGVEPTAYRLGGGRSILLSYGNKKVRICITFLLYGVFKDLSRKQGVK